MSKLKQQIELGDFQTPSELAEKVVRIVTSRSSFPGSIIEPTCGRGAFLVAAGRAFPRAEHLVGVEIQPSYLREAHEQLRHAELGRAVDLRCADFFSLDWVDLICGLTQPVLVVGNLPWVTSAGLGVLGSDNLPKKRNFQKLAGLDARTGKANFDIAEWMMIHLVECCGARPATIAVLLKTHVARRVLAHLWQERMPVDRPAVYEFDAKRYFGAAVDACLLVFDVGSGRGRTECPVYTLDEPERLRGSIGWRSGSLVSDVAAYDRFSYLLSSRASHPLYTWRSGLKHDCADVMELEEVDGKLINGLNEPVDIEDSLVFPLRKGSDVARLNGPDRCKCVIVPQTVTGEDTAGIARKAPKTWAYLCGHGDRLDRRSSSIYRGRPRFSIFGVGPYTFAPWKVAVCGLYKRLTFAVVGPVEGKPTVFDDTVYHLSCASRPEAELLLDLLNSDAAQSLMGSMTFWDSKRPITAALLRRIDLVKLARDLGRLGELTALNPSLSGLEGRVEVQADLF
jgi:hypothetical protein